MVVMNPDENKTPQPEPPVIEPPSNKLKSINQTTTPDSGSSVMVTETGSVIRRSARLAKKQGINRSMITQNGFQSDTNSHVFTTNQDKEMKQEKTFPCLGSGGLEKGVTSLRLGNGVAKRKSKSGKDVDKYGNDGSKKRRFSRADKGKDKLVYDDSVTSGSDLDDNEVDDDSDDNVVDDDSNFVAPDLLKTSVLKPKDEGLIRRRYSEMEKGKIRVKDADSSSNDTVSNQSVASTAPRGNIQIGQYDRAAYNAFMADYRERRRTEHKERSKTIAKQLASSFAHFSSADELELGNRVINLSAVEVPLPEPNTWPGQFATAMNIIKDRELDRNGEHPFAPWNKSKDAEMKWTPSKQKQGKSPYRPLPSLQDLCLSVLSENANSVTSLDFVPDMLRHKICWALCEGRRMNSYFLELLLDGSPTEIRIKDCSWLSEDLFIKAFEGCNTDKLMVLQFDLAGNSLPDYTLSSTLARSPNSLPALTSLSLKGAYRLTDEGLRMLVASAPNLKSVNLSECSMLTSEGVCCLINSLTTGLMELYLDACLGVDANLILSVLLKLESLEVLSLAGIDTVSDDFVSKLVSVHGCRMKEIVLADCMKLTDSSLEAIGKKCSGLNALDLRNLRKLTDVGIGHLANGCREIQMLKFCRSELSDEAVAAYLDIRGSSLEELSLNKLIKVSNNTAQSLARNCRNLRTLDLSWCRTLTNEDLGLIVDNCSSLELVKLFGCTQVTSVFLDGYSNPRVKPVGLKLTSVVQHINVPDYLEGPLRYSFPE